MSKFVLKKKYHKRLHEENVVTEKLSNTFQSDANVDVDTNVEKVKLNLHFPGAQNAAQFAFH